MRRHHLIIPFAALAILAGAQGAQSQTQPQSQPADAQAIRTCTEAELSDYQIADYDEVEAHRRFPLPILSYSAGVHKADTWSLDLSLLVGADGVPVCASTETPSDLAYGERPKVLRAISGWRYEPFLTDGIAAPIRVNETIREEERPPTHIAMPTGPAQHVRITLARSGCFGTCPIYDVALSGDGKVEFDGRQFVTVAGKRKYQVPAEDVARLVDAARQADIWSMRKAYIAQVTDSAFYEVSITIGGKTKTISDYVGAYVGMPRAITDFEALIDTTAHTAAWITVSGETVERLRAEGFDFASQAGADLLAQALNDPDQSDDAAVLALIEAGAPLTGGHARGVFHREDTPIDLLSKAFFRGRTAIAEALLKRDILLTNGVPDQARIDAAFQATISNGVMEDVMTMWAWHPGLTYQDNMRLAGDGDVPLKTVPVTLLLTTPYKRTEWDGFEIAQFLLAQGCDLNATDADDGTLLHIAATWRSVEFVKYLISRGARIEARDNLGYAPLDKAYDDDVAIALLEAGADPTHKTKYGYSFTENARLSGRKKVLAWLLKHGIMAPYPNPEGGY